MLTSIVPIFRRLSCRGLIVAAAMATVTGLGGCSSVPDAANPVEWYKGTRDWIVGEDEAKTAKANEARPVPGADKPFPKLDTVPDRPPETTEAERRQMANSLTADRDTARYSDEEIRRQSSAVAAGTHSGTTSAPAATSPVPASEYASPPPAVAYSPPAQSVANPAEAAPSASRSPIRRGPSVMNQSASVDPAASRVSPSPPAPPIPRPPPASASAAVQQMPASPPAPPDISPVIAAGQPIPVTPSPNTGLPSLPGSETTYFAPTEFPPNVRVTRSRQRTAAVQADRFSPRFPSGATATGGPVQASQETLPPLAALPPGLDVAPAAGFAPGAVIPPSAGVTPQVARQAPLGEPVATIRFGVGSSRLGTEDRQRIREAYRAWQSRGGRIHVVGHASSRTRNLNRARHELANFTVSYDRARAVARELIRLGVDPRLIVVSAMSDHQPAFIEVMPAGEAGNRRAEIIFAN